MSEDNKRPRSAPASAAYVVVGPPPRDLPNAVEFEEGVGGGPHSLTHVAIGTDPLLGITEVQLLLNFPTHSNALDHSNTLDHSNSLDHSNTNDPTAGEKAALPGTSGTPGAGNKYVTDADARNTNARTPAVHGDSLHDATVASLDGGGRVPTAELGSGVASAANFLRGDQSWAVPSGGGGGGSATNITVNVATPLMEKLTIVADALVSAASKIILGWGNVAQTDQNHPGMGGVAMNAIPGSGQFDVELFSLDQSSLFGDFKLSYMVL